MSDQVFSVPQKSSTGADLGALSVDAAQVDTQLRPALLKEALVMYAANRRQGTASTKTRGHIAGSRKKQWRQKGTGRARPGGRQNPVWRGGGTVFGPLPRDYSYSINKKQRRLALRSALFAKLEAGQVTVVDKVSFDAPRTKDLVSMIKALGITDDRVLIGTGQIDRNVVLSARNLPRTHALVFSDFNAEVVLRAKHVVLTADAFEQLSSGGFAVIRSQESASEGGDQ